jgi:tetratricopeptide (TPR) repeat protein
VSEEFERAQALFRAHDYAGCVALCRRLLGGTGDDVPTLHLLGVALVRTGELAGGADVLAHALELAPADLTLRIDRALALAQSGRLDAAVLVFAEGARFHPGNPDLAARLARLLSEHGRHADAQAVLAAALGAVPDHLELRGLIAAECAADLRIGEALAHLAVIDLLVPGQSQIHTNLGVLHQAAGHLDQAIRHYRRAIQLAPDNSLAHVNLATAWLSLGDFRQGLPEYERRLTLPHVRRPPATVPRWQGEPLAGRRLLVTAEQGYGDMIQFARFLPDLAALGADVVVECPPGLERLVAAIAGVSSTVTMGAPLPAADFAIPLLSLPLCLGCDGSRLAAALPYVTAPAGFALPPGSGLRVGLVWAGRPASGETFVRRSLNRRACALADLAALLAVPTVRWFSLQVGEASAELGGAPHPIADLAPALKDFADTAAAIVELDLVISVDTSVAHLAGALKAPLWVLLAAGQTDYRWGPAGGSSPWYPHARLFRAGPAGWRGLADTVAAALRERVDL